MLKSFGRALQAAPRAFQAPLARRSMFTDPNNNGQAKVSSVRDYNMDQVYAPKVTMSDPEVLELTGRPLPINVDVLHHAPLQHPQTHGHTVAELKFEGYHWSIVHRMADMAQRAAYYLGIPASGISHQQRKYKRWTVIRSPFAQAKSKQNFERVTYARGIKLYDANPDVVQVLLAVLRKHETAGVGITAKLFSNESPESLAAESKAQAAQTNEHGEELAQAVAELLKDPNFGFTPEELLDTKRFNLSGPNKPVV